MLQSNDDGLKTDIISAMIGQVNGNCFLPHFISEGILIKPDFGSSMFLPEYEAFPSDLSIGEYGVCDDYTQIIEQCPELQDPERIFLIMLTPILKKNQPESGGWRWHKWGDYIGTKVPQCEYLYHEPEIEKVFVYHIFEKR